MDSTKAKRITKELASKKVGSWTVLEYINNGKAGLVARANRQGVNVALKIFDPDLVERYGRDKQLERIEREKKLIGKSHPHLIEIIDGGACNKTGYLYVVMTHLPFKNLAQVLTEVPRDRIFPIISQIGNAAKFLEDLELVHRDIKPENIAISDDFQNAILLDLGVIRPLKLSELTDHDDEKIFIRHHLKNYSFIPFSEVTGNLLIEWHIIETKQIHLTLLFILNINTLFYWIEYVGDCFFYIKAFFDVKISSF